MINKKDFIKIVEKSMANNGVADAKTLLALVFAFNSNFATDIFCDFVKNHVDNISELGRKTELSHHKIRNVINGRSKLTQWFFIEFMYRVLSYKYDVNYKSIDSVEIQHESNKTAVDVIDEDISRDEALRLLMM